MANEEIAARVEGTRSLLAELLGQAPEVILLSADRNGRVTSVNAAAAAVLGRPEGNAVGMALTEFVAKGNAGWVSALLGGPPGRSGPRFLNLLGAGGSPFTVRAMIEVGPEGLSLAGLLTTAEEIRLRDDFVRMNNELAAALRESARKGRELAKALAELHRTQSFLVNQEKIRALGQLAGGVAHNFNNILQALLSLATVLRLRVKSPELATTVAEIDALVKRGANLTRQLLLFSQHEVTKKERIDLGETVSAAVALLRHLIPENVRLALETPPEPLWVDGDRGQIDQIIVNLAVNARDVMPGGGTLTVRTCGRGGEAILEVADTGHGIDEDTRAHLFEPFFTTKGKHEGRGLGLSVVHGIVERHGGRIEVESAPGQGARFRIVFPLVSPQEEVVAEQPVGEGELLPGHGERILLVEDEDTARRSLVEILEMQGYQVTALASGEEARSLPERPAPNLLLTDLMLPGVSGSQLAARLGGRWPDLKVVLMSGYSEDEVARRGVEAGTMRFLQKPFDLTTLAREIRAALGE